MASLGSLINPNIDYGGAVDVRMNNGNVPILPPTTTQYMGNLDEVGVPNTKYCPDGKIYLGNVNNKPLCFSAPKRYGDTDKQKAYEKAKAQGIQWTGQYTKDVVTGEVAPKPIEVVAEEFKAQMVLDAEKAKGEIKKAIESGQIPSVQDDNLLKKYWWVLAAIGVYLIISKD